MVQIRCCCGSGVATAKTKKKDKKDRSDFFFFFFGLFRASLTAYGSSHVRGKIGAAAAGHIHSHSNAESKPHLCPTQQLMVAPGL